MLTYTDPFKRKGYTFEKEVGSFTLKTQECNHIVVPPEYQGDGLVVQGTYDFSTGEQVLDHQIDLTALRTVCGDPISEMKYTKAMKTGYKRFWETTNNPVHPVSL